VASSRKDSALAVTTRDTAKEIAVSDKNKKAAADSAAIAKNTGPPAVSNTEPAVETKKNNLPPIPGKTISKQKKDTTTIGNRSAPPLPTAVAQAKKERRDTAKERKDTIIFMTGGSTDANKALAKKTTPQKEEKTLAATKKDSLTTLKKDTAAALVKNDLRKSAEQKNDSLANVPAKRHRPLVNKAAELLTDTSYVAVFVDESDERFDTIRISIPFIEPVAVAKQDRQPPKEIKSPGNITNQGKIIKDSTPLVVTEKQPAAPVVKTDTNAAGKATKDTAAAGVTRQTITPPAKKDSDATGKTAKDSMAAQAVVQSTKKDTGSTSSTPDSAKTATKPSMPLNSDCKETATESDIDKLRIKMLLVASDDDRIVLAKKVFKQKCFSVKQVKALSELFKTDEGKYKWFDAIYPFVSDSSNFSSLGELIKNDYYLNRFKAMLRN